MLEKNPENRISLKKALEHPYLNIAQEGSNMCATETSDELKHSSFLNDYKDL